MSIKNQILWRIYLVFAFVGLFGLAIIIQATYIQRSEGKYWRSLADSLQTELISIEAERGNIYSEDGRLMATSLPFFEIRMDAGSPAMSNTVFKDNIDSLSFYLAGYLNDKTQDEYKRILLNARKKGDRYLLIKRNVNYTDLQKIKKFPLFSLGKYKGGLIVIQQNKRVYPFNLLAKRTIGYVREGVQSVGLEGVFQNDLSGIQGQQLMQKISGGIQIPVSDENEIEPKNGNDLITSIDVNLQDVAENALMEAVIKHDADHGSVILMEVKTGKIKAIANLGKISKGEYWETYNYGIGESTEPGSTFKLASMIALIEDGLTDINDTVDLEKGKITYYNLTLKDAEEHEDRIVTVKRAFEVSSNVGISKLVFQNYQGNPQKYINRLYEWGLNNKTGIEIDGEPEPNIKKPGDKNWSRVSLPFISVGYEIQLTPLQTLALYNAIANGGIMVKPTLANEIQEYGKPIKKFEPQILNKKICSEKTIGKIRQLLEGVVEEGTARNIKSPNYKIAGKTGTAKIADKIKGYKDVYQSSFAGYFPADKPMYSCIVVINSPNNGVYYGSAVAAPVFKEIADKVVATKIEMYDPINRAMAYKTNNTAPLVKPGNRDDAESIYNKLGISFSAQLTDTDPEWVSCLSKDNSVEFKERRIIKGLVPDVTGMGLKDAIRLLEESGLSVIVSGKGKVRSQSLQNGTEILFKGQHIIIELG